MLTAVSKNVMLYVAFDIKEYKVRGESYVMEVSERGQQVWLHARPAESDACME